MMTTPALQSEVNFTAVGGTTYYMMVAKWGSTPVTTSATLRFGAAANTPPSISDISDQNTAADTIIGPINFTIGDGETVVSSLNLSKTSSNTTLVPDANIVFGGSGANQTHHDYPCRRANDATTIIVTVSDGDLTARHAMLTVTAVPPTITTQPTTRRFSGPKLPR
ncbi:MAG: hypothetical protein U0703_11910 [Anaerolineae bacterium]